MTVGAGNGQITIQNAGKIWGANVGVTATLSPGTPGTGTIMCIASDSGSIAPRMPQQNDHWQALGISPWGSWWGFQEASGSDTIVGSGSAAFDLTRSDGGTTGDGTGLHQDVGVDNWIRKGIIMSGSTAQRVAAAAGVGPNPSTHSVGWLAYMRIDSNNQSPASGRILGMVSAAAANQSQVILANTVGTNGSIRFLSQVGSKTCVGPLTHEHADRIHPILFIYNRTTAEVWIYSDNVIAMSGAHVAIADDIKGFGARNGTIVASSSLVWGAMASGSIVENLCTPSASADFLNRLGWNVSWKTCPTDSGSIKLPFLDMHWKELGLKTWTAHWNMQDSSAQGANSYDRYENFQSDGWTLAQGGTVSYEQTAAGWNRRAITLAQSSTTRINRACASIMQWDPTGSQAMIGYISASNGAANPRAIMGYQGAGVFNPGIFYVLENGTSQVLYCAGATATSSQTICDGRYHPVLMVYDKTNSRAKYYTDLEKMTGSFNALSLVNSQTGSFGFGGFGTFVVPPPMGMVWGAFCTGTIAESLSDDGIASDFLKKLGWTVSW